MANASIPNDENIEAVAPLSIANPVHRALTIFLTQDSVVPSSCIANWLDSSDPHYYLV